MPIWLTIIFAIIQNLPTIIKVLKEIFDMLKNRSKEEKEAVKADIQAAMKECADARKCKVPVDHDKLLKRLEAIAERLRNK